MDSNVDIYDLIYSHADRGYIAVPRDGERSCTNLHEYDSGPPSALGACTLIPQHEMLEFLGRYRTKWGAPLTATREEKNAAFKSYKINAAKAA